LTCLRQYTFPGNIRELRNILERASLLTDSNEILPQHLPEECVCKGADTPKTEWETPRHVLPLESVEKNYLQWVNAHYQGDKRSLAQQLGLSERTLYRKLQSINED
jgi:DNA-binding NtrC family response regulator